MANMGYCRFRNTLADLRDCYEALTMGGGLDDLSEDEAAAAARLIKLCATIAADYGEDED